MNPEAEIEHLRAELNFHLYRYHVLDAPIISDGEYDELFNRLLVLEHEHPHLITTDSPTQRAGAPPQDTFEKVVHPAPILSLSNAFDVEEFYAWRSRIGRHLPDPDLQLDYVAEPKLDGLTIVLTYENGLFERGATRGNGEIGEDITQNLRTIRALPQRLPVNPAQDLAVPPYLVVRGEAFFPLDKFEAFNEQRLANGEPLYMNPRNAAAGSLRQLDSNITAQRPLTLYCYDIILAEGASVPEKQWDRLAYLRDLGFPVSADAVYCADAAAVTAQYEIWIDKRNQINYEVDGMVVKINNRPLADSLGFVGKDPRGAVAMKFPAQEKTTRLLDVQVNVGRTGVLAPAAMLAPVEIGGVIVRNATLHNFDEIERKDIRIGDSVLVKRAGDVIPYVIGPIIDLREGTEKIIRPPQKCPFCGEPVVRVPGEVAIYCDNPSCPEQLVRRVEYFVGRGAMDIDGFGAKTGALLVQIGIIHDLADIYYLEREALLALEGFQEKKVDNIFQGVENSKQQPADRFLTALGIRFVGNVVAALLLDNLGSIDALAVADQEQLELIDGIGPGTAVNVVTWFSDPRNQALLEKFRRAGLPFAMIKTEQSVTKLGPFVGKVFVITGTLPTMSRDEAKAFIETHGGKVTGSVSKNTDFLLAGEKAGSKLKKATDLGVPVLAEEALREMGAV